MKNIKHLIAFLATILVFGTSQAATPAAHRSSRVKDPWQIMQSVLYNHFVDTTGLCVVTPIDASLLVEITPDLAKAFHVKEKVDLSHAETLGEVLCAFMMVKYAGRSGQTYDYYKYRYSDKLIYDKYLERYPDSPYAAEMRLKNECLKQYNAWLNSSDAYDCFLVILTYDSSYCPYGGFAQLATLNNESRELAQYYVYNALLQENHLFDNDDNNNLNGYYILFDDYYNNDSYDFSSFRYDYGEDGGFKDWIVLPMDENENNNRPKNNIIM